MKNKVSIIIPCYNSEKYIRKCIESALNQNYNNIEVIVINDGSTDNSLKILNSYENNIILISQKNQGACVARNKGIEVATGEFIKFLDADDYLAKDIIKSQATTLMKLNERTIVFGNLTEQYENHSKLRSYYQIATDNTVEDLINTGIITASPLHRKKLLQEVGGFDIRFKNWQEWNLHIRLGAIGTKFFYQPENVYFQRFHDGQDRISNLDTHDLQYEISKRLMTLESIEKIQGKKNSVSEKIALSIWELGRQQLRKNNPIEAEQYFKESLKIIDITKKFSYSYRIMQSVIGHMHTENLILNRKRFTQFRKNIRTKTKGTI